MILRQVQAGATSLTLQRNSRIEVQATGTPASGQFTESVSALSGSNTIALGSTVDIGSNGTGQITKFSLVSPTNPPPAPPVPGGLAQVTVSYQPPTGTAQSKTFNAATFGMSCYLTALESDWGTSPNSCGSVRYGPTTYSGTTDLAPPSGHNPPYLSGTFCTAFLRKVKNVGSAVLTDGRTIAWANQGNYTVTPRSTADGTVPVAGQTVARDRAIIPGKGVKISLDGFGTDLKADDIGDLVKGYRIDFYAGVGNAACSGKKTLIVVGACTPGLAGCPASDPQ